MNIHMTCVNAISGAAKISQSNVLQIARGLGIHEMNIYNYAAEKDSDSELHCRIDGIIAGLWLNDIVFLQYPTWNRMRFDNCLAGHVKAYHAKLIIFVHDLYSLMWQGPTDYNYLSQEIAFFNRADLLILPSRKMHQFLQEHGLSVKKVLYQQVWDYPTQQPVGSHEPIRRLFLPGWEDRCPYIKTYSGKTPLLVYSSKPLSRKDDNSVQWRGYREPSILLNELAEGGFGLVWSEDTYYQKYCCMNQSFKVGTFLAAGIPLIIRKGTAYEDIVKRNHLGFITDSLAEADEYIQNITYDEYRSLYENVSRIQYLVTNGHYTRKLLEDAIITVLEDSF